MQHLLSLLNFFSESKNQVFTEQDGGLSCDCVGEILRLRCDVEANVDDVMSDGEALSESYM